MDYNLVEKIKRLTIIALASDDELVETLVLKGGNAIDITYGNNKSGMFRASYDLDYSIVEGDFEEEKNIKQRIENTLISTFHENGFQIFDFKFNPKPQKIRGDLALFWGGYKSTFKVLDLPTYQTNFNDHEKIRRIAIPLNPKHSPTFELEFSKFEYVVQRKEIQVDGYTIFIYTPEMIVFEKLRAICQQLEEYKQIVPSFTPRARARDFYDIHLIMEMNMIDPKTIDNKELISNIFEAKKVPLSFIKEIKHNRSLHADNWKSVIETMSSYSDLKDFNFYFDFIIAQFDPLTFP